jgi:PAS domain S-box-containing protein
MRLFPYPDGVAALVLNRSRELALRQRWARCEAKSAALAVLPQVACVELDLRGVFNRIDPAYSELVGFGEEELKRFRLTEIIHPKARAAFTQAFEAAVQGEPAAIPTVLLSKGGRHRAVEVAVALAKHQELPEAILVIVRACDESAEAQRRELDT